MATNLFVQFGDIKGECEDRGHRDWCEITSLGQDFTNAAAPLPAGEADESDSRRGKHSAIKISKVMDKASIGLMKACWAGDTVAKVVIECFRSGSGQHADQPIKYFSIELINVIIKKFDYSVGEGQLVSEDLELVAAKASYEYRQMDKRLATAQLSGEASIILGQDDHGEDDDDDDDDDDDNAKKKKVRLPVTVSHF